LVFFLLFNYFREHPLRGRDISDKYFDLSGPHFLLPFSYVKSYLTVSKNWRELTYQLTPCSLTLSSYGFTPTSIQHLQDWWPALQRFQCISKMKFKMQDSRLPSTIFGSLLESYSKKIDNLQFSRYACSAQDLKLLEEKMRHLRRIAFDNCQLPAQTVFSFLKHALKLEYVRFRVDWEEEMTSEALLTIFNNEKIGRFRFGIAIFDIKILRRCFALIQTRSRTNPLKIKFNNLPTCADELNAFKESLSLQKIFLETSQRY